MLLSAGMMGNIVSKLIIGSLSDYFGEMKATLMMIGVNILGIILLYMVYGFGKRALLSTIILVSLQNIFFIPRAEATGWLTFIVYIQFWLCIAVCYGGTLFCYKTKLFDRLKRKKAL